MGFGIPQFECQESDQATSFIVRCSIFLSGATVGMLLLNALGIISDHEFAHCFAMFIMARFIVCFNFSRLLMHALSKAL
jgi:hypothetical protein